MPLIDSNEIPRANISNGQQDAIQLFARDFLSIVGFKVLSDPNCGQDETTYPLSEINIKVSL